MRVKHILFPIDFSEQSRLLNSEVEWLATQFDAKVTLLHVIEIPNGWYGGSEAVATLQWFRDHAEKEKTRLEEYTIGLPEERVRRLSAQGGAGWHIAEYAKENNVDLIVMGTHGYGTLNRMLLGSVAMKVLHDVDCPVWTHTAAQKLHSSQRNHISSIICSVDSSNESVGLLEFVADLAVEFRARVELVHAVADVNVHPANYFDSSLHRALRDWATQDIAKRQLEAGTSFPLTICENNLATAVADLAVRRDADLVVIGRGRIQGTLGTWRTNAYEIIRRAPCPVLSFCAKKKVIQPVTELVRHVPAELSIA